MRPVPRNEWDLDPGTFGPYGPTPFELAAHPMECMRVCRVATGAWVRQLDPGVSML